MCLIKQRITAISRQPKVRKSGFFNMNGIGAPLSNQKDGTDVQITEIKGLDATDMCNISLTNAGEYIYRDLVTCLLIYYFINRMRLHRELIKLLQCLMGTLMISGWGQQSECHYQVLGKLIYVASSCLFHCQKSIHKLTMMR